LAFALLNAPVDDRFKTHATTFKTSLPGEPRQHTNPSLDPKSYLTRTGFHFASHHDNDLTTHQLRLSKMHLPTILAAVLLPLAAVAEDLTTTTSTSTLTLTKTLTLQRAAMTAASNSSATFTSHSATLTPTSSTTSPGAATTSDQNAGSALAAAHLAALGIAGVVAAALL
jgi:carbohydrate-binding DOMON domain-containing protein